MKIVIVLLLFLLVRGAVYAAPMINEISPKGDVEWVELYNPDDVTVDLTGWMLRDSNTKTTDDLILNGTIEPHGYVVFSRESGWLNDSGEDTVSLYASGSAEASDSYMYSDPIEGKSIARIPDHSSSWIRDAEPTQGTPNVAPSPAPSPSPSPSPTPSPSPVPTLPSSPSPSPSPSRASPSPQPSIVLELESSPEGTVAGVDIDLSSFGSSPAPRVVAIEKRGPRLNQDRLKIVLPIGVGLICISGAGYFGYRKYRQVNRLDL